jgi:hypothetical protein
VQKRFSRFSRRSIVGAVVGVAFAAAAGVGLAQITAAPSTTVSAVSSTIPPTGTETSSQGSEDDFANDTETSDDALEFEQSDNESESTSSGQTTSTIGGATTGEQTTTSGDEGNGQEKVDVCHMTGSGKAHTINIARPAVAAHVAHGDTEGACAETTATTSGAQSTTTTTHHVEKPKHVHSSTHGSSTHTTHGNSSHTSHGSSSSHASHGNSNHESHGNSGSSHGSGSGHGNGKGK